MNQIPFILLPPIFQKIAQSQVRNNKMVNEHSVNYHLSPSRWNSRMHSLIFLQSIGAVLSQTCIFVDNFRIFGAQITRKCNFASQKSENFKIFTHQSQSKIFSQVLITALYHPSRQKLLTPLPDAALFLKRDLFHKT